ncbi:MAG TPA: hypothetical protein VFH47_02215 [Candidatus Thermoplasmatota archaeon]|nr:hypothetical protein [Candidatus Thermoplasmatota archaeon]
MDKTIRELEEAYQRAVAVRREWEERRREAARQLHDAEEAELRALEAIEAARGMLKAAPSAR